MGETASRRVRLDRPTLSLVAGDVLVLVAVVVAGEISHGIDPLARPVLVLDTLAPFLVGWTALAALLGAYGRTVQTRPLASIRVGAGAWVGAANVGLILRSSPLFHGGTTYPFNLVITATVLVGLVAWRAVAAFFFGRRGSADG